jgi:acyl CoA:acetate/3-ketoacid CoA transferase alpha subunit/acyl CoA:acetate/3-ketoacid CoA transferase beta subunit
VKTTSLADAIERHVEPGDTVHVMLGHSRWTAAARELARQFWSSDPGFTLVMASLGSLGALFFRGGLVAKVVTAYSGDSFPTYSPNPIFTSAYDSGAVEVEHWSFLTLAQRLEAAARGLPAAVTGSLAGSDMARENSAYQTVETRHGPVGLVAPLRPDVALLHAAAADEQGNVLVSEPLLEGLYGAWAARRGVIATVERVVDDVHGLGQRVRLPAHRVLAVVEAPFGAHPGGCYAAGLPVHTYGEDIGFWIEAAQAARGDFDGWARRYALEPQDHAAYLRLIGHDRLSWLESRSDPASWKEDADANPVPVEDPVSDWETAAALAAREVLEVAERHRADALLAGAGVANLAAWVAADQARSLGRPLLLTAELGLWDYRPTPADPYIFNHRVFPDTAMLADAQTVLGLLVGGPGTRVVACLGAAEVDRSGNINSTRLSSGRTLVGSGGGNDVASRADACVVVTLAQQRRLPENVGYVTAPGGRVESIVTDLGVLRRLDGTFRVAAVLDGTGGQLDDAVRRLVAACGWAPDVARDVQALPLVSHQEVLALREYDRQRTFLR